MIARTAKGWREAMQVLGGWRGGTECRLRRGCRMQLGALRCLDLFLQEMVSDQGGWTGGCFSPGCEVGLEIGS